MIYTVMIFPKKSTILKQPITGAPSPVWRWGRLPDVGTNSSVEQMLGAEFPGREQHIRRKDSFH